MITKELGFPVDVINPPLQEVMGQIVPMINWKRLARVVVGKLLTMDSPLTGDELRFLRKEFGLTHKKLEDLLDELTHKGIDANLLKAYEDKNEKKTEMSGTMEARLRMVFLHLLLDDYKLVRPHHILQVDGRDVFQDFKAEPGKPW